MKTLVLLVCLVLGLSEALNIPPNLKADDDDFPDIGLNPHQMIERVGYPAETHYVTTVDGYILQVHRISQPGGPAIMLQHGSLSSSADWILMGLEKSIAYMLHDLGYDVWLGNARGNTWSRNHTFLNPDQGDEFWDFSFHEMGIYDLPAVIDHIMTTSGVEKIDYIGHSMGTTMFWVLCSEKPEYNDKIHQMHAFAPVAWMGRVRSPLLLSVVPWVWTWDWITTWMGSGEYMPSDDFNAMVGAFMCEDGSYLQEMCAMEIFMLCGYSPSQLNDTTLPLIKAFSPAGTSTKTILHFTKQVISWNFEFYDYGWAENMIHYGQTLPPNYHMNRVTAPVYLHWTHNDLLAHPQDVEIIHNKIANSQGLFEVPLASFSHIDFMWGIDAKSLVYDLVFELLANP